MRINCTLTADAYNKAPGTPGFWYNKIPNMWSADRMAYHDTIPQGREVGEIVFMEECDIFCHEPDKIRKERGWIPVNSNVAEWFMEEPKRFPYTSISYGCRSLTVFVGSMYERHDSCTCRQCCPGHYYMSLRWIYDMHDESSLLKIDASRIMLNETYGGRFLVPFRVT